MRIINRTKNTVICLEAEIANTSLRRLRGLLGREGLKPSHSLVLRPCNSVHTFFMRFPIDVLFVSKDNRVVKAISQLTPFRITAVYFSAVLAIELPSGTIKSTLTSKDDILAWESLP